MSIGERLDDLIDAVSPAAAMRRWRVRNNGLARANLLHLPEYKRRPLLRERAAKNQERLRELRATPIPWPVREHALPVAWQCQYGGGIHKRGAVHPGDTPLVPGVMPTWTNDGPTCETR